MRENEQRTMKMMTIDALFLVSISFRQLYSNKMGSENVLHYLFIKKKEKPKDRTKKHNETSTKYFNSRPECLTVISYITQFFVHNTK